MSAQDVPDALLERYLAEALDEESRAHVEALLERSVRARTRLEELRADSAAHLLLHPPWQLVERFKQERRRAWWKR